MKKDRLSRGKSRQGAAFPVAPPKTALSFSPRNLLFMRAFAENCPDLAKVKQAVSLTTPPIPNRIFATACCKNRELEGRQ
jgi:hypothetical protein